RFHRNSRAGLRAFAVVLLSTGGDGTLAALDFVAATKRAAIHIWGWVPRNRVALRIGLITSTRVSGQRHAGIARAMVRPIASDYPALRKPPRLPRELDCLFVRVGAGHSEKYPTVLKARLFEQRLRQFCTRLR